MCKMKTKDGKGKIIFVKYPIYIRVDSYYRFDWLCSVCLSPAQPGRHLVAWY